MTEAVSVENYEIKNSRSDYAHILEYLCKVFFLTTLDIYKDYFKGHHSGCKGPKVVALVVTCIKRGSTNKSPTKLNAAESKFDIGDLFTNGENH